jgi:hypothetical protein
MPRFIRRSQIVISGKFHHRDWDDGDDNDNEEDEDEGSGQAFTPVTMSVTATAASPCVFTWGTPVTPGFPGAPLPFEDDESISLSGTVPAGFTAGVTYYAVATDDEMGTFALAATPGGPAINSTSTGVNVIATLITDEPPVVQPTAVTCLLHYWNMLDQEVITTVSMTMDSSNRWSGTWDSTDAKPGRIEWAVYSTGAVVAATQGAFQLHGNDANIGNIASSALFAADDAAGINQ